MTLFDQYTALKKKAVCYYAQRAIAQLGYAIKLSAVNGGKYDAELIAIADGLIAACEAEGTITVSAAKEAEKRLSFLSAEAKKIKIVCVSHAHIDMNWMWGMQETASTALDTFRTMLDLMKEYPKFTFSQSQASVYRIVEENDPEMLEEIRARVKEGRWEVTASTWVETDKNMPNGESLARHILYTKRYLSKLLDIAPDAMQLDFEPDTFGHNWTVPEIMNQGGVKYYYHCRGYEGELLYNWQSRSGAKVLVYREPKWYNAGIEYDMFYDVPQFCDRYGVDVMLKVYGVGNHGGGPTRRDVERIADMMTWPVMPTVEFGTYHGFFKELERFSDRLPVVNQELNFVFTGCYTTQTRVKMANRISEERLYEAEALSAAAGLLTHKSQTASFAGAWERVLFNHFHDILPGSGVVETREYALGEFQKVLATAQTNTKNAMRAFAAAIDTSSIPFEYDPDSCAEGGGVGYAVDMRSGFQFPQAERGNGKVRAYHMFNPTMFDRKVPVEITVFDWDYDLTMLRVTDMAGNPVEYQVLPGKNRFWGHECFRVVIDAQIPAFGYTTYMLTEGERTEVEAFVERNARCDHISDEDLVMENDHVRAVFDRKMRLVELCDKKSGKLLVTRERPSGIFRLIMEDDVNGMTAWRVGNYMQVEALNETVPVRINEVSLKGIHQWIRFAISFRNSSLDVMVTLDKNSSMVRYAITVDWHEIGTKGKGVPQLAFWCPLAYSVGQYRYDIPFGVIDRPELRFDVPANSYAAALNSEGKPVVLVADTKYGFRGEENSLGVDLIRASYDPDPYPEYGIHKINLGLAVADNGQPATLKALRDELCAVVPYCSATKHTGSLPLSGSLFRLSGDAIISAVKTAEDSADGGKIVIRLYNPTESKTTAKLAFKRPVSRAEQLDINENILGTLDVTEKTVSVEIAPNTIAAVAVSTAI